MLSPITAFVMSQEQKTRSEHDLQLDAPVASSLSRCIKESPGPFLPPSIIDIFSALTIPGDTCGLRRRCSVGDVSSPLASDDSSVASSSPKSSLSSPRLGGEPESPRTGNLRRLHSVDQVWDAPDIFRLGEVSIWNRTDPELELDPISSLGPVQGPPLYYFGPQVRSGAAAAVHYAIEAEGAHRSVAVLSMRLDAEDDPQKFASSTLSSILKQNTIYQLIDGKMQIKDIFQVQNMAYLVMTLMDGDLNRLMQHPAMSAHPTHLLYLSRVVVRDISAILAKLHVQQIVHSDVCPANILWHADGSFFLADHERAAHLNSGNINEADQVPDWLRPPELVLPHMQPLVTPSLDVWGLVASAWAEILCGANKSPFASHLTLEDLRNKVVYSDLLQQQRATEPTALVTDPEAITMLASLARLRAQDRDGADLLLSRALTDRPLQRISAAELHRMMCPLVDDLVHHRPAFLRALRTVAASDAQRQHQLAALRLFADHSPQQQGAKSQRISSL